MPRRRPSPRTRSTSSGASSSCSGTCTLRGEQVGQVGGVAIANGRNVIRGPTRANAPVAVSSQRANAPSSASTPSDRRPIDSGITRDARRDRQRAGGASRRLEPGAQLDRAAQRPADPQRGARGRHALARIVGATAQRGPGGEHPWIVLADVAVLASERGRGGREHRDHDRRAPHPGGERRGRRGLTARRPHGGTGAAKRSSQAATRQVVAPEIGGGAHQLTAG